MSKKTGKVKGNKKGKLWKRTTAIIILVFCAIIIIIIFQKMISARSHPASSAEETIENGTEEPNQMEVTERAEASYERWLAAGMVTAISMQYSEFEINGIYLTGETDLTEKADSNGVYVIFTEQGVQKTVYSVPLEGEREEAGTMDLYTRDLGFATFDMVEADTADTASCIEIQMDDLDELISQSLLVSLYEH